MTTFRISRIAVVASAWGSLGFYRGMHEYDYDHEKNKNMGRKKTYFYSAKIANGFLGCLFYLNPILAFPMFSKEIYRIEVALRGMECEKKTDKYNQLT